MPSDIQSALGTWRAAGTPVAIATVVRTWGSSPRPVGAKMAVTADSFVGSVSGGCVETAVIQAAREVLAGGPARLLQFGVADETAWAVGLACGGEIEVRVEPYEPTVGEEVSKAIEDEQITLIVVGAVHIAAALVRLARVLGYRTVVVDPRREFASGERFPDVDALLVDWPDRALADLPMSPTTAVAVLTHDPKIDDPALRIALASDAFYVGALGSRATQASRRERLASGGLTPEQLDRLHGPIGLDIGAATPEEIAVAVLAEIVAARRKG